MVCHIEELEYLCFQSYSEASEREKNQLNCILTLSSHFRRELQALKKVLFEPNLVAVSWSLLN